MFPNDPSAVQEDEELASLGVTPGGTPRSPVRGVEPVIPGLDPDILSRLSRTKEQLRDQLLRKRVYNKSEEDKSPLTGKDKLKGFLKTLLSVAAGAPTPAARARSQAEGDFNDETSRIGQNIGEQRVQGQVAQMLSRLGMQQQQLDSLNTNRVATLQEKEADRLRKTAADKAKNDVQTVANSIRKFSALSNADLQSKQGALTDVKTKISQFQADHPDMKPGQLLSVIADGVDDPAEALKIWQQWNQAKGIGSMSQSSSVQGVDPNTGNSTNTTRNLRMKIFGGGGVPGGGSPGGTFVNPQFANPGGGKPVMPPVTPPTAPLAGDNATPASPIDRAMQYSDPRIPIPAGAPLNKEVLADRMKRKAKFDEIADTASSARNDALGMAATLHDAMLNDTAGKFTGPIAGSKLWNTLVDKFGKQSVERVFQDASRPHYLMETTKADVGSANRMTQKEISMEDVGLGGKLTDKPENAIIGLLVHGLKNDRLAAQYKLKMGIDPETSIKSDRAIIAAARGYLSDLEQYRNAPAADKLKMKRPEMPTSVSDAVRKLSSSGKSLGQASGKKTLKTKSGIEVTVE